MLQQDSRAAPDGNILGHELALYQAPTYMVQNSGQGTSGVVVQPYTAATTTMAPQTVAAVPLTLNIPVTGAYVTVNTSPQQMNAVNTVDSSVLNTPLVSPLVQSVPLPGAAARKPPRVYVIQQQSKVSPPPPTAPIVSSASSNYVIPTSQYDQQQPVRITRQSSGSGAGIPARNQASNDGSGKVAPTKGRKK